MYFLKSPKAKSLSKERVSPQSCPSTSTTSPSTSKDSSCEKKWILCGFFVIRWILTKKKSTQPSQSCSSKGKVQVWVAGVEEEGGGGDDDGEGGDDEEQEDGGEHLDLQSTQFWELLTTTGGCLPAGHFIYLLRPMHMFALNHGQANPVSQCSQNHVFIGSTSLF